MTRIRPTPGPRRALYFNDSVVVGWYMIYSAQFEQLPLRQRPHCTTGSLAILSGKGRDRRYLRLSPADRRAIIEILRDTKPDLPAYFR